MKLNNKKKVFAAALVVLLIVLAIAPTAYATGTVNYINQKGADAEKVLMAIAQFAFPVGAILIFIGLSWVHDANAIRAAKVAIGALLFFAVIAWGRAFIQADIEKGITTLHIVDMLFA